MSAGDAPRSPAELERWDETVQTMEAADGDSPGRDTRAARAALEAARPARGGRA